MSLLISLGLIGIFGVREALKAFGMPLRPVLPSTGRARFYVDVLICWPFLLSAVYLTGITPSFRIAILVGLLAVAIATALEIGATEIGSAEERYILCRIGGYDRPMSAPRYTPREMIEKLVSFDTTSRNSNLPLIEFVSDYLERHGVAVAHVPNAEGTKANLYATLGPNAPGGIVLSGHTDVVPVDGQAWVTDPWTVTEAAGKLFGRGTTDMKSFSAVALALVPEFLARGLRTPLHFALSYDEEVGCIGVRPLIERLIEAFPRPRLVVVGEPTNMTVVTAHKGIRAFKTTVLGHEVHSSQTHKGVNAIAIAAELIQYLGIMAEEEAALGDASGRFEPPYTSIHVGLIEGGTALNIVPRSCRFIWEFRPLPGTDEAALLARFEKHCDGVRARIKKIADEADIITEADKRVPPFRADEQGPAVPMALKLSSQNATHAVSYGTEAGLFEDAGLPTVICGPGDIAQAHQPNEFVALEQIALCERFFRRLMDEVCF